MGDLTDFVASVAPKGTLRVEENLGGGFVRLRVAEAERRQAKHDIRCVEDIVVEMLRNSRDAGASMVFVATTREGDQRTLVVLDDGCGIPEDMRERVFEARVTSKLESMHMDRWGVHGRGMALFSVIENAEDARVMDSVEGGGTSIRVLTDATKLAEKADQSTWPSMGTDDDGLQAIARGPHNIIRTCCEFALEERGRVEVSVKTNARAICRTRAKGGFLRSCAREVEFHVAHLLDGVNDGFEVVRLAHRAEVEKGEWRMGSCSDVGFRRSAFVDVYSEVAEMSGGGGAVGAGEVEVAGGDGGDGVGRAVDAAGGGAERREEPRGGDAVEGFGPRVLDVHDEPCGDLSAEGEGGGGERERRQGGDHDVGPFGGRLGHQPPGACEGAVAPDAAQADVGGIRPRRHQRQAKAVGCNRFLELAGGLMGVGKVAGPVGRPVAGLREGARHEPVPLGTVALRRQVVKRIDDPDGHLENQFTNSGWTCPMPPDLPFA